MCGIAGIFNTQASSADSRAAVERMQAALAHRGPDDEGLWQSECGEVMLAHRRLSILDLSSAGHQPMTMSDGRLSIVFNGEIYNFRELRAGLERSGATFKTQSDTEVILRLYEQEGKACVKRLRGMFAFAIWDAQQRVMLLARDPLGIKPLYVHLSGGTTLAFASELRALSCSGIFKPTLNAGAVQRYFETGTVPEPLTLVSEVLSLRAGHLLEWRPGQPCQPEAFWKLDFTHEVSEPYAMSVARTREALIDSVRSHFVSDVPVGVFLSGGIDSTALLALAGVTGHKGLRAFSISVDDSATDESPIARRTAQHFGADYHEKRLDAAEAQRLFGSFLEHLDQPSIDGLNTFTVSALAREQGMKVVLSGLGGDEVFGGYSSFRQIPTMTRLHRWMNRLPLGARVAAAALRRSGEPSHRRMAAYLQTDGSMAHAYRCLRGIFTRSEAASMTSWITGLAGWTPPADTDTPPVSESVANQISELELSLYMRNQLLRDSDVMSMANGLELRVPFVDRALLDTVSAIPAHVRLQSGKKLLTDAVPEVPEWVVNQKKRGFLFPFQMWLGSEWGASFAQATRGCPVATPKWYQVWSVFVLRHCMDRLHIAP